MRKVMTFVAAALVSTVAGADQLLVTAEKAGRSSVIGLDYTSSGTATAFEFRIEIPGGEKAKVNLSGCLKGLPKSHAGQCAFSKGAVVGIVYSDMNDLLPSGLLNLGTIGFSSSEAGSAKVVHFLAADPNGSKIDASVELGSESIEKNLSQ